jgi:glycerophosphoryl diester phosphodiesterase
MGADGVECDVRLTRDGVLVCLHDRTVDRTSNGTGVVSTMTLADLHRLDFGSWHGGEPAGVLTLEVLLETLRAARRPVEIAIETKHPTRYGGRVEREVAALLGRMGIGAGSDQVTARVMSFSPPALASIRRLAPQLDTVQLMQRIPANRRNGSLWAGATCAGPSLAAVKAAPEYVERAHRLGHQVHVWTVDAAEDVAYLASLGVDAVITNRPDVALARLGR